MKEARLKEMIYKGSTASNDFLGFLNCDQDIA
jgi:hypothetical protein